MGEFFLEKVKRVQDWVRLVVNEIPEPVLKNLDIIGHDVDRENHVLEDVLFGMELEETFLDLHQEITITRGWVNEGLGGV